MFLDNLYKVIKKSTSEASVVLSDESHPVFKAHFPSQPILPAFVHLEIISDVFDIEIVGVKKAKFTKMVLPNDALKYIKENNKIKVLCNEDVVANFSL